MHRAVAVNHVECEVRQRSILQRLELFQDVDVAASVDQNDGLHVPRCFNECIPLLVQVDKVCCRHLGVPVWCACACACACDVCDVCVMSMCMCVCVWCVWYE